MHERERYACVLPVIDRGGGRFLSETCEAAADAGEGCSRLLSPVKLISLPSVCRAVRSARVFRDSAEATTPPCGRGVSF